MDDKLIKSFQNLNVLNKNERKDELLKLQVSLIDELIQLPEATIEPNMIGFLANTERIALICDIVTRRKKLTDGKNTNVVIIEEYSNGCDLDNPLPITFKWKREPNPSDMIEERFKHKSVELMKKAESNELSDEEEESLKKSYKIMEIFCGLKAELDGYSGKVENIREEPDHTCKAFTRIVAAPTFAYLLDAFHPESQASLYHVCKIMNMLLRLHTENLLQFLVESKKTFKVVIETLLDYIHCPCVSDLVQSLLCPIPRNRADKDMGFYHVSQTLRKTYFSALGKLNILLMIGEHIWLESSPENHKMAAAEMLECVVSKYAGIDGCSDILSSLVRSPELLGGLIKCACGIDSNDSIINKDKASGKNNSNNKKKKPVNKKKGKKGGTKKKNIKKGNNKKIENNKKNLSDILKDNENDDNDYNDLQDEIENCDHSKKKEVKIIADHKNYAKEGAVALDTLRSIIELAKKKEIPPSEPINYTSFAEVANELIECQLSTISDRLFNILEEHVGVLCDAMIDLTNGPLPDEAMGTARVQHSSYFVEKPFSNHRLELLKLVSACITHRPKALLPKVSLEHWSILTKWFFEYPHSNLYHVEYRNLFEALLRSCAEINVEHNNNSKIAQSFVALEHIFFDCKFIIRVIDLLCDTLKKKKSNHTGHALILCNFIRLQAQALPKTHFLNLKLNNMIEWNNFLPKLKEETHKLTQPWPASSSLQFASAPFDNSRTNPLQKFEKTINKLLQPQNVDRSIDLGSDFANSLGFENVSLYEELR